MPASRECGIFQETVYNELNASKVCFSPMCFLNLKTSLSNLTGIQGAGHTKKKNYVKDTSYFAKRTSSSNVTGLCFNEDSGLRNHAIGGEQALRTRGERQPIWNNYRRAVVEYTKRTTSDESDAVNAFQGIVSLLQPAFKGDFLFGLPETELDIALLWQPTSSIRKRVNPKTKAPLFPSWRWVGWIGGVAFPWTRNQLDDLSQVEWECTDSKGGNIRFCTSNELRAPKHGDHDRWECVPDSRGTPYYDLHKNPDIWCLHPVAPKEKRSKFVRSNPFPIG